MERKEVIVVGAGPAGMSAAVKLCDMGFTDILVIEKEASPGGVLRQCIHPGFGLTRFGKNLTGPEYKAVDEKRLYESGAELLFSSTVMDIRQSENGGIITSAHTPEGLKEYVSDAVILASGCRETGRGFLEIPGSRPAGIFTAGTAQAMMNLKNTKVGERIVIVGSGDIGLIMARRFTLEGSQVLCVVEKAEICGGLERNRKECLEDYNIPLLTSSAISCIKGKKRVNSVTVRDRNGEEQEFFCDTVVLSAGLVPEDGMAGKDIEGLFYCGNVLYVHDLADDVSVSGEEAAIDTAGYLISRMKGRSFDSKYSSFNVDAVREERKEYIAQRKKERLRESKSGKKHITCIMCPNGCRIDAESFTGGRCNKGENYARNEKLDPKRILTAVVRVKDSSDIISVRTDRPIPKSLMMESMKLIRGMEVSSGVKAGDTVAESFILEDVKLIATCGHGSK
ncbi:MAG: DUF1667 domain-containing protein [Clostridiales bacterium]|nr:DUF1667 domain-containing protein [Clostridiales bacterium]